MNNHGFYYDPYTDRVHKERKSERCLYFPSKLEYRTYKALMASGIEFIFQHPLVIQTFTESFSERVKKFDFWLPQDRIVLECKGSWINNKPAKESKSLFLAECQMAEAQGLIIVILDDLGPVKNRKPWSVGPYEVEHYEDYIHGLHSP